MHYEWAIDDVVDSDALDAVNLVERLCVDVSGKEMLDYLDKEKYLKSLYHYSCLFKPIKAKSNTTHINSNRVYELTRKDCI